MVERRGRSFNPRRASALVLSLPGHAAETDENVLGPRPGYFTADRHAGFGDDLAVLFNSSEFQQWSVPMGLDEPARQAIKGHPLDYYLTILHDVRQTTLAEFRKRDDQWLMAVDKSWPWGPTNNLCKWFHVCEHESHHTGQISLLRGRVPGAKPENG